MPLSPGAKLGDFEILEPIGAGGMGEVYRARDTKLDRDVAVKVLPDELASDEERAARFEREAKVLASLNHPNIAGIYGFVENALDPAVTRWTQGSGRRTGGLCPGPRQWVPRPCRESRRQSRLES